MEKIKFSDVAHFYLGCEIVDLKGEPDSNVCTMETVCAYNTCIDDHGNDMALHDIIPLLRKLESIEQHEACELEDYMYGGLPDACCGDRDEILKSFISPWPDKYRPGFLVYVRATNWLRRNSFDIDQLIENGEAVELTSNQ